MERRSCSIDIDDENDIDDETNEDDNNSNINIPITSYINLGNYMYNQKQSNY